MTLNELIEILNRLREEHDHYNIYFYEQSGEVTTTIEGYTQVLPAKDVVKQYGRRSNVATEITYNKIKPDTEVIIFS